MADLASKLSRHLWRALQYEVLQASCPMVAFVTQRALAYASLFRQAIRSHQTLHEALGTNVPISCGGVAVFPGDVPLADKDGVM